MYFDRDGKLRSMPASWTSVCERDSFLQAAAGQSWFRIDDLLELAELLQSLEQGRRTRRRSVK